MVASGCAQMAEPTGGDKDTAAPEIMHEKTLPRNGTVNFTGNTVSIYFSEYIQIKSQQVVITPAMDKKPVIKNKGKRLDIEFKSELQPNTTYTINLSGAIVDITEANPTENLQYVFSTGPYLDSLSIGGTVVNAFTQKGVSGMTVILHADATDSTIYKSKPAYFLKTRGDGSFRFFHLKQGHYRIYAINDQNADLLFSQYPEDIAFLDTVIALDNNVGNIELKLFKPEEKKTYLRSTANVSKYVQVFRYNKLIPGLKAVPVKPADSTLKFYAANSSDSVFYMSLYDTTRTDTMRFKVQSNDSVLGTLNFIAHLSPKTSGRTSFRLSMPGELYVTDSIFISAGTACVFDREKISLTDTLHKKPVGFNIRSVFNGVSIFPDKQTEKIPIRMVCAPGAFKSLVTLHKNDTIKGISTLLPEEKMGAIKLTLSGLSLKDFPSPVLVFMLENTPVKTTVLNPNNPTVRVDYLKPGNYNVYLFNDPDQNRVWSPGNLEKKLQPEKIIRYAQPIKVKANWDQDLTWKL